MTKFIKIISLLLLLSPCLKAQDNKIFCNQAVCQIATGIQWASGNQTWIFKPLSPEVSFEIFIHNNNTTNGHSSQVVSLWQTPSPSVASLSNNADLWQQDTLVQNITAGASCNNTNANNPTSVGQSGLGSCFGTTLFAAQAAIKITGAASAAGSPDTFDIFVIQKVGEPKSTVTPISTSGSGAVPPIQMVSDLLSQAFVVTGQET